jgi:hypothetical protein
MSVVEKEKISDFKSYWRVIKKELQSSGIYKAIRSNKFFCPKSQREKEARRSLAIRHKNQAELKIKKEKIIHSPFLYRSKTHSIKFSPNEVIVYSVLQKNKVVAKFPIDPETGFDISLIDQYLENRA